MTSGKIGQRIDWAWRLVRGRNNQFLIVLATMYAQLAKL